MNFVAPAYRVAGAPRFNAGGFGGPPVVSPAGANHPRAQQAAAPRGNLRGPPAFAMAGSQAAAQYSIDFGGELDEMEVQSRQRKNTLQAVLPRDTGKRYNADGVEFYRGLPKRGKRYSGIYAPVRTRGSAKARKVEYF